MDKNANEKGLAARLEQVEIALAHQSRATEELSEVIARQDGEIARLTKRVEMLMRASAEQQIDGGGTIPLSDQRPPHW